MNSALRDLFVQPAYASLPKLKAPKSGTDAKKNPHKGGKPKTPKVNT